MDIAKVLSPNWFKIKDEWYNCTTVIDGNELKHYVNGELVETTNIKAFTEKKPDITDPIEKVFVIDGKNYYKYQDISKVKNRRIHVINDFYNELAMGGYKRVSFKAHSSYRYYPHLFHYRHIQDKDPQYAVSGEVGYDLCNRHNLQDSLSYLLY